MTTPDTITRRRLYADCGQLRALTPFESALLRQPCADRRWDAAIVTALGVGQLTPLDVTPPEGSRCTHTDPYRNASCAEHVHKLHGLNPLVKPTTWASTGADAPA